MKTRNRLFLFVLISLVFSAMSVNAQTTLTIEDALDIAAKNSPVMRKSMLNLQRSSQNLIAQRASLKSQFNLSVNPATFSRSRKFDDRVSQWYTNESYGSNGTFSVSQPILLTDGTISLSNSFSWQDSKSTVNGVENSNQVFQNNLNLRLSQPLFTYNRRKMELKTIELEYENAGISYAMQRLSLERSLTQQFYSVYMAQMQLDIAKDELANAKLSYDIIKNKVDADLAAREELYQAEVNYASAVSSVQDREVSLANSKDDFKQSIGMDIDADFLVMAEVKYDSVAVDLKKAVDNALASRMELRQREITLENAIFSMIRVKSQNEFSGTLNASMGITGDDKDIDNIFKNQTQSPSVSVSLNIPLYDFGEKKARIKAQEASMESNEIDFEEEKKSIELDLRKVYRNLQNQLNQIKIAEQSVRNAQLTYDLNQERYRNGDITGMSMNQYQQQLSSRKVSYSQSLINYRIELLNLKVQALYDFEKDEPVIPSELYPAVVE